LCIRKALEEQTPPRLIGTGRGVRSCLNRSERPALGTAFPV
jgi:hypothetical protein